MDSAVCSFQYLSFFAKLFFILPRMIFLMSPQRKTKTNVEEPRTDHISRTLKNNYTNVRKRQTRTYVYGEFLFRPICCHLASALFVHPMSCYLLPHPDSIFKKCYVLPSSMPTICYSLPSLCLKLPRKQARTKGGYFTLTLLNSWPVKTPHKL